MISSKRVLIANLYCKYKASIPIPTRKLHQGLTKAVVCRCSIKRGVFKNFANFTGKHLCWSLFLNKVTGLDDLF